MAASSNSLLRYVLAHRRAVALGLLLVALTSLLGLAAPFALRYAIDELTSGRMVFPRLMACGAVYVLLALASSALSLAMRRITLGLSQHVEYEIRRDAFAHLLALDAVYYQHERTGDLMTKLNSDLGAVRDLVGQGLLQSARTVFGFLMAFGVMFALNVRMAATVLAILPFVSVAFFFLVRLVRSRYDAVQEQLSALSNYAQESFAGVRTIKGFGVEARRRDGFGDLNEELVRRGMSLARIENPIWPFMVLAFAAGIALLLVVGGRQVIEGRVSLGEFVQFNQYLLYLQWPMLALGWMMNLLQRGRASWVRLRAIFDARPEVSDRPSSAPSMEVPAGDVVFDHVRLVREGGRVLLDDVQLVLPQGRCIGITGPTGSGKTLLVSLIVRLLDPTEGVVRIGPHDVREFSLAALRRYIGMAPQEPFLFSETVADNLAFGVSGPEGAELDEQVLWAAEVAHLRGDVEIFPQKFQTLVGERGVTLSGGQRQRAALGRALARRPGLLILDDVFSAVDTQTEARILDRLREVFRGRTTILISHRVSTLRHADRLFVLENGRVTQQGSHEQLVLQPGYYRTLDEIQRLEARLEET